MNDLISRADAIAVMKEECWKDREMKLSDRIERRLAALPAASQPEAETVLLEVIEWSHRQPGNYPDWFDRARKAVGQFDGDAGQPEAEPVASQISTIEAVYSNMPDIPELPDAYQPRNIAATLRVYRAARPTTPAASQPEAGWSGMGGSIAPKFDPNCECVCHSQPGVMHVAPCCQPQPEAEPVAWHPEDGRKPGCDKCGYFFDSLGGCKCRHIPLGEDMALAHPATPTPVTPAEGLEVTEAMVDAAFAALPADAHGTIGSGEMYRVLRAALRAQQPAAPVSVHPDDLAVDRFAAAMKAKLAKKREEGRGGWEGPDCNAEILSRLLREHVEKGDPLDVGNLAMMLHQRGDRVAAAPVSGALKGERT